MKFKNKVVGSNRRRAHRIARIAMTDPHDIRSGIVDLVTDIHHFCNAMDLTLDTIVSTAHGHYVEETAATCIMCSVRFDPTDVDHDLGMCPECNKKKNRRKS